MNDQTMSPAPRCSIPGAILATAMIAALFVVPLRYAAAQQTRAVSRFQSPTIDVVEVDGQAARVLSATGGDLQGVVVTIVNDDPAGEKMLQTVTTTPVTLGWDLSPPLGEWIEQTIDNATFIPKTLTLASVDSGGNYMARKTFRDAVLAGIAFPALDRGKTEPANIALRVLAPSVQYQLGGRMALPDSSSSKAWLNSNFQIEIDELPTQRVSRVEPFTWTLQALEQQIGEFRSDPVSSGRLNIDNLKLVISASDFNDWANWMDSFLIRGDSGSSAEKNGVIRFLGADLQQVLLELQLEGIGLVSMTLPKVDAATGTATFTAEVYVEQIHMQRF